LKTPVRKQTTTHTEVYFDIEFQLLIFFFLGGGKQLNNQPIQQQLRQNHLLGARIGWIQYGFNLHSIAALTTSPSLRHGKWAAPLGSSTQENKPYTSPQTQLYTTTTCTWTIYTLGILLTQNPRDNNQRPRSSLPPHHCETIQEPFFPNQKRVLS